MAYTTVHSTTISSNVGVSPPPLPEHLVSVGELACSRISKNGLEVLMRRYIRKQDDGKTPAETIPEMFWRVSAHVCFGGATELVNPDLLLIRAEEYYRAMLDTDFFPNSPTFTGKRLRCLICDF